MLPLLLGAAALADLLKVGVDGYDQTREDRYGRRLRNFQIDQAKQQAYDARQGALERMLGGGVGQVPHGYQPAPKPPDISTSRTIGALAGLGGNLASLGAAGMGGPSGASQAASQLNANPAFYQPLQGGDLTDDPSEILRKRLMQGGGYGIG